MDAPRTSERHDDHRLGKYRLIAQLGRGGMADVHLAVLRGLAGLHKLVAVKLISPQFIDDPEYLGMFLDEARITARLGHPNLVQSYEIGEENGRYFMAMEYLEGQTLYRVLHRLRDSGGLPLAMHLRILADACAGLDYAHNLTDFDGTPLGIVHRDVTPHNIFVTYEGGVKLVDFGIAKARGALSQTRGVLRGKIGYMAPEQVDERPVDRRADIFAVGVMLWEAATGRRLWEGKSDLAISSLRAGVIPHPSSVSADVHPALEAIIVKALAPDPIDRHLSAAELGAEIEAFLEGHGQHPHARDLGRLVANYFEDDRARMRCCIEHAVKAALDDEVVPSSERATEPEVMSCRDPSAPPIAILPAAPSLRASADLEARGVEARGPVSCTQTRRSEESAATLLSAIVPRTPLPSRSLLGWLVGAGVMGAVLFAPVSLDRLGPRRAAIQSVAERPRASPSAPIDRNASVAPRALKTYLDGDPVASNPGESQRSTAQVAP